MCRIKNVVLYLLVFEFLEISDAKTGFHYVTEENGKRKLISQVLRDDLVTNWTAVAFYNESFMSTGWDLLEVRTNFNISDEKQMLEAGYLEGYLTHKSIYYFWHNNIKDMYTTNDTITKKKVIQFVSENKEITTKTAKENLNDPFWYQVHLANMQIKGIYEGYKAATSGNNNLSQVTEMDIYLMNLFFDLSTDLNIAMKNLTDQDFKNTLDHCSALIKLLPGFKDVFIGHNTWTVYSAMNRIYKKYHFPIHISNGSSQLIPGMEMTFSSYPGIITSGDDFYVIKSGLITLETTNQVVNRSLYKQLKAKTTLFENFRSAVANRLAVNGSSWIRYYSMGNSGTYNNQWMIIDLNKFSPGFQPENGFLWIVEQMPGFMKSQDETSYLLGRGYWTSYNIPFFKETLNYSGYSARNISYYNSERGLIMRRMHSSVHDLDSMYRFMINNDYKNDIYSECKQCPVKQSPAYAIASRYDLIPVKSKVIPGTPMFSFFGSIDFKIVNYKMFTQDEVYAGSGPTNNGGKLPNFRWSTAQVKDTHHLGQPDLWDFKPLVITFPWRMDLMTEGSSSSLLPQTTLISVTFIIINIFYLY